VKCVVPNTPLADTLIELENPVGNAPLYRAFSLLVRKRTIRLNLGAKNCTNALYMHDALNHAVSNPRGGFTGSRRAAPASTLSRS
jgi:hypothetical protein